MIVSNRQIGKTLRLMPPVLLLLVAIDVLFLFIPGFFGGLKLNGYVAIAIPLFVIIFYSYVGYPLFTFNAQSDVVKIKSHLALSTIFGKRLEIPKMNITDLNIDRSGIRKKLVITYIKNGREENESFSITILSKRKLQKLEQAVENIHEEKSPKNLHFFI
jgi:hypothetical protein